MTNEGLDQPTSLVTNMCTKFFKAAVFILYHFLMNRFSLENKKKVHLTEVKDSSFQMK